MSRQETRYGNLGWLILVLGILLALPVVNRFLTRLDRSTPDSELVPRSEKGTAYLLVDNKKYLLTDKNGDGRVDCLVPTGFRGFARDGIYSADDPDARCSRSGIGFDIRPMSPGLRETLSALAARKYEMDASHTSCIDLDDDEQVDCVVSVHNPDLVMLEAPDAQCAARGQEELEGERRRAYSEILALEQAVRKEVLDGP
jgi:hypothetical protein